MTINAYLIDPAKREITRLELPGESRANLNAMYAAIGCETVDCARFNEENDGVFIDDEGLFAPDLRHFFYIEGYPQPLAGKGVVLGCDGEGDSVAPTVNLDWLRDNVAFIERLAPHAISVMSPSLEMTMRVKRFFI